jgi:hypothetical protein
VASFPLTVTVTPNAVQLKPGGSVQLSVHVSNVSDIVEHYQVTIVGLPSDDYWVSEPAVTKLRPRESGTIGVRLSLPERGGILGGRYVLGVLVTSPYQPNVARSADLILDVTAVSGITLTANPMTASGTSSASYALSLTNDGNIDVPVDLVATDDHGKARITITPPSVYVRPGGAQAAQVFVEGPSLLTGQERRSTITIKALAAGETRGEVPVTFIQPPRIAPAVFRTLGIVLGVAVVAGAIVIGGILGRNPPPPPPPPQVTSTGQTSGATSAGSPTGGGTASTPAVKLEITAITVNPAPPVAGVQAVLTATVTGVVENWVWEIRNPDGNVIMTAPDPRQLAFTFPEKGIFKVRLTVSTADQNASLEIDVEVVELPPKYETVTKPLQVGPGQAGNNAAPCSEDLVALGGGVDVLSEAVPAPPTVLQNSFGTGDGGILTQWTGALLNPGAEPVDVSILTICAEEPAQYGTDSDDQTTVDPGTSNEFTLTCPDGQVVFGGGGGIRSDTVVDTQSFLEESAPVKETNGDWTGWRVRAHNFAGTPQPLTVQIICGGKPDGYAVVEEQQTVVASANASVEGQPTCPDKTVVLSGGAGVTGEIPRDATTQTVLRESAAVIASDGSETAKWFTRLNFAAPVDQSVTTYAVCANLPR